MTAQERFDCELTMWLAENERLAAQYPAAFAEFVRVLPAAQVGMWDDYRKRVETGTAPPMELFGFSDVLKECGPPPASGPVELVRVNPRRGFLPGNLRWATAPTLVDEHVPAPAGRLTTVFVKWREVRDVYGLNRHQFDALAERVGGSKVVRRERLEPPPVTPAVPTVKPPPSTKRRSAPPPGLVSFL